jgi:hypothetical protein
MLTKKEASSILRGLLFLPANPAASQFCQLILGFASIF